MRTGLSAALVNTGTIFMAFGLSTAIIGLLGARYGAPIHRQPLLGAIGLIGGGLMFAAGYFMDRSRNQRSPTR
jgi:hypothetical protein